MLARLMSNLLVDGEILLDNIKAVIFDKDGTLIDIHHYWTSMIKIRASLVALKWFDNNERDRIENHLIDVMGVNLETGQMKPDGPVGVKPRPFNVGVVADFVLFLVDYFATHYRWSWCLFLQQTTTRNIPNTRYTASRTT